MCAAQEGHVEAIRVLVTELGANIEASSNKGNTAIMLAAHNGKTEAIRVLVQLGADINTTSTQCTTHTQ